MTTLYDHHMREYFKVVAARYHGNYIPPAHIGQIWRDYVADYRTAAIRRIGI